MNRITRYKWPPDVRLASPEPKPSQTTPSRRERSQRASTRILDALCVGSVVLMGLMALAWILGYAAGAGFRVGWGL